MSSRILIEEKLATFSENQLIFTSKLYAECFSDKMTEEAYYKALQRLRDKHLLTKIAKGVYCKPSITRFGEIFPSDKQIVEEFTRNETGMLIGYSMYNALKLTTQVAKSIEVYTSSINEQQKKIKNVFLKRCRLNFDTDTIKTVQMLEVLQNYSSIQDLNIKQFLKLCQAYSESFDATTCEHVLTNVRYSKRTIAFLHNILNYHNINNPLGKHISSLSNYKIPSLDQLYN